MSAHVTNTLLVMTFGQAEAIAKGFTDNNLTLARGVRKVWEHREHGATAVHKAMETAYAEAGKTLAGFKLSSFKHAHAVAANLGKQGHLPTDEDFDRWAVAGIRIVRTVKFGGVMKFTDTLATEGVGDSIDAVESRADEIESARTDERRDVAQTRAARPNDGSTGSTGSTDESDADESDADEPKSAPVSGTNKGVVAVAGDATSLSEVSLDRLIREIEGRIRTGCEIDATSVKHFDRMVEAYAERMATVTA